MTDYGSFKYGNVQYPLPASGSGLGGVGASLLRDADPALFYLLEFCESILRTHLESRFTYEATACGAQHIGSIVSETLPLDPVPFLTEQHIKPPLLAAYRKSGKPIWIGSTKHSVDDIELVYVLPTLQAGEAERLLPILRAVAAVLDNRIEQGFDPAYTPTSPTGTAGESWWKRAGVVKAGVMGVSYGEYAGANGLFFPAVTMNIEMTERSDFALDTYDELDRVDADIDIDTVTEVVQIQVYPDALLTEGSETLLTEDGSALRPST